MDAHPQVLGAGRVGARRDRDVGRIGRWPSAKRLRRATRGQPLEGSVQLIEDVKNVQAQSGRDPNSLKQQFSQPVVNYRALDRRMDRMIHGLFKTWKISD